MAAGGTQTEEKGERQMADEIKAQTRSLLWVDWTERVVSFHEASGFERLEFSSDEEKLEYVFQKTSGGFRIQ